MKHLNKFKFMSKLFWSNFEWCMALQILVHIDLIHKSHNAPVPNPTMHHFVTEMASFCNRNVFISVTKWCIVGYLSDALWDL